MPPIFWGGSAIFNTACGTPAPGRGGGPSPGALPLSGGLQAKTRHPNCLLPPEEPISLRPACLGQTAAVDQVYPVRYSSFSRALLLGLRSHGFRGGETMSHRYKQLARAAWAQLETHFSRTPASPVRLEL